VTEEAPQETIISLFQHQESKRSAHPALRTKRAGAWETVTWGEWGKRSRLMAAELIAVGAIAGDRVAIFANTREEWLFADVAILLAGGITVPIYQTLIGDQAAYILDDSGAKMLFAESAAFVQRIFEASPASIERLAAIVLFDGDGMEKLSVAVRAKVTTLREVLAKKRSDDEASQVKDRASRVAPKDLATLVYTSGTTGPPKGVMLTHQNFAFETGSVRALVDLTDADEQLLFLPMAHIFAKTLVVMQIRVGSITSFAESVLKAMDNAMEVNPTYMGCVPRLYEKIYAAANDKAQKGSPLARQIYASSINVGRQVARHEERGEKIPMLLSMQRAVADKLVLSKVRARFGNRIRFAITGGAPLAKELMEWFHGTGLVVLEGYGLTETTAASNLTLPSAYRFGTVGGALPGVEVKIAADGEVLIRGPNVMRGYWKKEEATREVLEENGWLHSGDIGVIDEKGFLKITDRKKDIIVTAGGKNVSPQNIENLLKQSPWISQAMVHGDKRPYLVALVTLNPEAVDRFAKETGRTVAPEAFATDADLRGRLQTEINGANAKLSSFESVKKFAILPKDFTIEGGELTPTLKVKRKVVTEQHRSLLDKFYDGGNDVG
jgi:long-chain acyl-CoA synthetase